FYAKRSDRLIRAKGISAFSGQILCLSRFPPAAPIIIHKRCSPAISPIRARVSTIVYSCSPRRAAIQALSVIYTAFSRKLSGHWNAYPGGNRGGGPMISQIAEQLFAVVQQHPYFTGAGFALILW